MTKHSRLWAEFDNMAYNLKGQAHSGVSKEMGNALLDVAARIEKALQRFPDLPELDPTELECLGEVRPGGRYLLRATVPMSAELGDRLQQVLKERFPESTFAILTQTLELVQPDPLPHALRDALAETRDWLYGVSEREQTPAGKAAARTTAEALNRLSGALARALTKTGDAPSPQVPGPPQCDHWANEERGQGRCIHGKGHPDSLLHQDSNGNRWSW